MESKSNIVGLFVVAVVLQKVRLQRSTIVVMSGGCVWI